MPPKLQTAAAAPAATSTLERRESLASSDLTIMETLAQPLPPDGGYGWVVVGACFVMNLICDGCIYSFGSYQDKIQKFFHKETAQVAFVVSIGSGFYYGAAPIWGAMGNKYGFRLVGVIGASLTTVAYVSCYFLPKEYFSLFLILFGVVAGIGAGMVYISTMIMVGFYFDRWRGAATAIASCGSGAGVVVMPLCYNGIANISGYDWKWILLINSGLGVVAACMGLLLRPLRTVSRAPRVRFVEEHSPKGRRSARGRPGPQPLTSSTYGTLRQLHSSQTSFAPSVVAPQFDAISVTSRGFSRSDGRDALARPMHRDDIFFTASSSRLGSLVSRTTVLAVDDEDRSNPCNCCPAAIRRHLENFTDLSLLNNSVFILFMITQVFTMLGYYTPFLYLRAQALETGTPSYLADWILPTLGIANCLGRLLCGLLCEIPGMSALIIASATLTGAGIVTMLSSASTSVVYQFFIAALYGLFIAPVLAMKSLILVDFLGLDRLTNAFALLLMFQGLGTLLGPPLAGWIKDYSNSFTYSFCISGGFMFVCANMMYLMYPLSHYEMKKKQKPELRSGRTLP